jgi:hypothetical protein
MTAREQAEQLRQQAIQTLVEEKEAIDVMLTTLGYDEKKAKRRGRPPKQQAIHEVTLPVEQQNDPALRRDEA